MVKDEAEAEHWIAEHLLSRQSVRDLHAHVLELGSMLVLPGCLGRSSNDASLPAASIETPAHLEQGLPLLEDAKSTPPTMSGSHHQECRCLKQERVAAPETRDRTKRPGQTATQKKAETDRQDQERNQLPADQALQEDDPKRNEDRDAIRSSDLPITVHTDIMELLTRRQDLHQVPELSATIAFGSSYRQTGGLLQGLTLDPPGA